MKRLLAVLTLVAASTPVAAQHAGTEAAVEARRAFADQRYSEALPLYQRALRASPADDSLVLDAALCRFFTGDSSGAFSALDGLVRAGRGGSSALANRGYVRFATETKEALRDFERALELDPRVGFARAMRALGRAIEFDEWSSGHDDLRAARKLPGLGSYWSLWLFAFGADVGELDDVRGSGGWYADIARFFRGEIGSERLLALADASGTPVQRAGRRCEAHCFIALSHERRGDTFRALAEYAKCIEEASQGPFHGYIERIFVAARTDVIGDVMTATLAAGRAKLSRDEINRLVAPGRMRPDEAPALDERTLVAIGRLQDRAARNDLPGVLREVDPLLEQPPGSRERFLGLCFRASALAGLDRYPESLASIQDARRFAPLDPFLLTLQYNVHRNVHGYDARAIEIAGELGAALGGLARTDHATATSLLEASLTSQISSDVILVGTQAAIASASRKQPVKDYLNGWFPRSQYLTDFREVYVELTVGARELDAKRWSRAHDALWKTLGPLDTVSEGYPHEGGVVLPVVHAACAAAAGLAGDVERGAARARAGLRSTSQPELTRLLRSVDALLGGLARSPLDRHANERAATAGGVDQAAMNAAFDPVNTYVAPQIFSNLIQSTFGF